MFLSTEICWITIYYKWISLGFNYILVQIIQHSLSFRHFLLSLQILAVGVRNLVCSKAILSTIENYLFLFLRKFSEGLSHYWLLIIFNLINISALVKWILCFFKYLSDNLFLLSKSIRFINDRFTSWWTSVLACI